MTKISPIRQDRPSCSTKRLLCVITSPPSIFFNSLTPTLLPLEALFQTNFDLSHLVTFRSAIFNFQLHYVLRKFFRYFIDFLMEIYKFTNLHHLNEFLNHSNLILLSSFLSSPLLYIDQLTF